MKLVHFFCHAFVITLFIYPNVSPSQEFPIGDGGFEEVYESVIDTPNFTRNFVPTSGAGGQLDIGVLNIADLYIKLPYESYRYEMLENVVDATRHQTFNIFTQCPEGTFYAEEGCYSCPSGYDNNILFRPNVIGACQKRNNYFASLTKENFARCPSGQFEDITFENGAGCYRCEDGYENDGGVCKKKFKAEFVENLQVACWPHKDGYCRRCPSGYVSKNWPENENENNQCRKIPELSWEDLAKLGHCRTEWYAKSLFDWGFRLKCPSDKSYTSDIIAKAGACQGGDFTNATLDKCFQCPSNLNHDPSKTPSTDGVCFSDTPKIFEGTLGCKAGEISGIDGNCYACGDGTQHDPLVPLNKHGVCYNVDIDKATFVTSPGNNSCPSGQLFSHNACWSCPSDFTLEKSIDPFADSLSCKKHVEQGVPFLSTEFTLARELLIDFELGFAPTVTYRGGTADVAFKPTINTDVKPIYDEDGYSVAGKGFEIISRVTGVTALDASLSAIALDLKLDTVVNLDHDAFFEIGFPLTEVTQYFDPQAPESISISSNLSTNGSVRSPFLNIVFQPLSANISAFGSPSIPLPYLKTYSKDVELGLGKFKKYFSKKGSEDESIIKATTNVFKVKLSNPQGNLPATQSKFIESGTASNKDNASVDSDNMFVTHFAKRKVNSSLNLGETNLLPIHGSLDIITGLIDLDGIATMVSNTVSNSQFTTGVSLGRDDDGWLTKFLGIGADLEIFDADVNTVFGMNRSITYRPKLRVRYNSNTEFRIFDGDAEVNTDTSGDYFDPLPSGTTMRTAWLKPGRAYTIFPTERPYALWSLTPEYSTHKGELISTVAPYVASFATAKAGRINGKILNADVANINGLSSTAGHPYDILEFGSYDVSYGANAGRQIGTSIELEPFIVEASELPTELYNQSSMVSSRPTFNRVKRRMVTELTFTVEDADSLPDTLYVLFETSTAVSDQTPDTYVDCGSELCGAYEIRKVEMLANGVGLYKMNFEYFSSRERFSATYQLHDVATFQ